MWSLVRKELEHHGLALFGAAAAIGAIFVVTLAIELTEESVTLLSVAWGMALVPLPALTLWLAGRLVVQEFTAGTQEFLQALPVSPAVHTMVRYTIGWIVVQTALAGVLVANALVASRRESVPLSFVVAIGAMLAVYLTAWHSLSFAIAHTGRYRWLVWWLLLIVLTSGDAVDDWSWTAVLQEGAERARIAPPWTALPIAGAWAVAGFAAAMGVATWRGGALVERWFRPATADVRVRLVAVGVIAPLVMDLVDGLARSPSGWEMLPPAHTSGLVTVRAAASADAPLTALAARVGRELDALGADLGVSGWPGVVLLRAHPEPGSARVSPARGSGPTDAERVLLVDPELPEDAAVEAILAEVLGHAMAGSPDADADARFVADGLAAYHVGGDLDARGRLAAVGADAFDRAADARALEHEVGRDVARAVAGEGFAALAELGGPSAPRALGAALLARWRWPGASYLSVVPSRWRTRAGWIERETGVDEATLRSAWSARLHGAEAVDHVATPQIRVERDGEVLVAWDEPWPDGAVLEWIALDALQRVPLPGDVVERVVPEVGATSIALSADLRAPVVARSVVPTPAGRVASAWTARP